MYLADFYARKGHRVHLVEKESAFMARASYANQARVHNGYHYPRSVLTALRSRVSFPRFTSEFTDCIVADFTQYYLIAKPLGHITAKQFLTFCRRIDVPCEPAPVHFTRLTNPAMIEASFVATECAFDAIRLRDIMIERLHSCGVMISLNTAVETIQESRGGLLVEMRERGAVSTCQAHAGHVFNCTYSLINTIHHQSGVAFVPLKHELAEICLVAMPDELRKAGVTVMCGPFFSAMPFPTTGLHSFTHVRYTPHAAWHDSDSSSFHSPAWDRPTKSVASAWGHMQRDAARYLPILSECQYDRSIWEVKTVLPRSESDDSRPILFRPNHGLKGLHCLMGGKIDNVYDVVAAIESSGLLRT